MPERTPTTDYKVVSLHGRSQAGGNPDKAAEKYMAQWGLVPSIDRKQLYKTIPPPSLSDKYMLKTWREGSEIRAQFMVNQGIGEYNLERGQVIGQKEMGNGSSHVLIIVRGNYLFEVMFECRPIAENAPQAISIKSISSDPPLILEENALTKPPVNGSNHTEPNPALLETIETKNTKKKVRKMKTKEMTEGVRKIVGLVFDKVCRALDINKDDLVKSTGERSGPLPRAKQAISYLLKDEFGVSSSIIQRELAPNAANSGVIYGFASTAKKHMKKDAEFLSMIERITEEVRVETKMSGGSEQTGLKPTRPAITSSASKGRQPEKTPVNNSDGSPTVQESCMYALIQMGHKPETIASAFGTDLAGIYQAIGHVTMHLGGGNAQVCSAIRVAANL